MRIAMSQQKNPSRLNVAVLCGGPSQERGISLNSARSVLDHLSGDGIEVTPFYVDPSLNFYELSRPQIYSNTPSDFDFKLRETSKRLGEDDVRARLQDFDLVFPAIHGAFGEDGQLQEMLEDYGIPFVGSPSLCCRKMFNKNRASFLLEQAGFHTLPSLTLRKGNPYNREEIERFFADHKLTRAIIKPSAGGSSIGVYSVQSPDEAIEKLERNIFATGTDTQGLLEPFSTGREFTIIVLEGQDGKPVALVPTEISMSYENGAIFDFRRKYLPTNMVSYHCPPRFEDKQVAEIQGLAEKAFGLLGMRDFARLDGWLMPDGNIWFSDFNPISGMEQNSFLFQQPARLGMSHGDILRYIVASACRRHGLALPPVAAPRADSKPVRVLFGGATAERQVSLMSGTNVWLKLNKSDEYTADPCFLSPTGDAVWQLPYMFCLFHTVEEIAASCDDAAAIINRLSTLVPPVRSRLGLAAGFKHTMPVRQSLPEFIADSKQRDAFVFLALHGGMGEDGTLQTQLDAAGLSYNGSGADASRLCMDKDATGAAITAAAIPGVMTAPKMAVRIPDDFIKFTDSDYRAYWDRLCADLKTHTFIIKPQSDGCSAGVIHLRRPEDIKMYVTLLHDRAPYIQPGTFTGQKDIVEMSRAGGNDYLIEAYIRTDTILASGTELMHKDEGGWIELTVGVLVQKAKNIVHVLNPSITVAEGAMLSLEEKFQGGTGVNITPPPQNIVSAAQVGLIKEKIAQVAKTLGIDNYARIDLFFNRKSGDLIVIEANSLPGLTPATVLYHQALAEQPRPLFPVEFLSLLIKLKLTADQNIWAFLKPAA
jgi:D-alanine--D-alanine ligase